jgi:Ca2+-transporting ATPase
MNKWHTLKIEEVFQILQTSEYGLSKEESKTRLKKFGLNRLKEKKRLEPVKIFLRQFKNFLVLILIVAALISIFTGFFSGKSERFTDAYIIIVFIILITSLGFVQEFRAEKTMEALKKLTAPKTKVRRDGKIIEIPAERLVPGDVILLEEGDRVPADARLFKTVGLKVDESSLTGESIPITKDTKVLRDVALADRKNMVFLGTIVSYGKAEAVVVATGMQTEMGKIAKMAQVEEVELTPLQKKLDQFGKWIGAVILVLCGIVFLIGIFKGEEIFRMFLTATALAVSAVPQGLPIVITVTLALGMWKMAKQKALIKKLSAVETLGCTTVICADKTGTMTTNEMTVRKLYCNNKIIDVTGVGFEPKGEFISDSILDVKEDETVKMLLRIGLLCNNAELQFKEGSWKILGDPTEGALLVLAAKANLWKDRMRESYPYVAELPFSSERKMMTTIHKTTKGLQAYVKGAPETVLELCNQIQEGKELKNLEKEEREKILGVTRRMAAEGLRVLAFAYKKLEVGEFTSQEVEKDLIFVGLAGMIDPPRKEVKDAIGLCKQAGIKVVMITGDHKSTALAVAKELGLIEKDSEGVLTGPELEDLTDEELVDRVEEVKIYARVSPEDKSRILRALKTRGEIVAMTGDGVNDAPALKDADIGVAMGIKGTDVAKEASDMVLTDDNFATIVRAVEEGRGIYDNIRKFVRYILAVNFSEIFFVSIAILAGLPLPLLPIQILWINLLTDGFPALALSADPKDPEIMKRKPRDPRESVLHKMIIFIIAGGCLALLTEMGIFVWTCTQGFTATCEGYALDKARTMAFTTAIMFELFFVFNCRSEKLSAFRTNPFSNRYLVLGVLATVLLQAIVIYVPFFNSVFGVVPLSAVDWLIIILLASSGLLLSPKVFLA